MANAPHIHCRDKKRSEAGNVVAVCSLPTGHTGPHESWLKMPSGVSKLWDRWPAKPAETVQ